MKKRMVNDLFRSELRNLQMWVDRKAATWQEVWEKHRNVKDCLSRLSSLAHEVPDEFVAAANVSSHKCASDIKSLWPETFEEAAR